MKGGQKIPALIWLGVVLLLLVLTSFDVRKTFAETITFDEPIHSPYLVKLQYCNQGVEFLTPMRVFQPFPAEGILNSVRIDRDAFTAAQETYYQMLGWNHNGVPTDAALKALDLEWAIPYIA